MNAKGILTIFLLSIYSVGYSQIKAEEVIRLNQIGFYPAAPKIAVVYADGPTDFSIATPDLKKTVYNGKLSAPVKSLFSLKQTRIADITSFNKTGLYVLVVPGLGQS